jgi:hypothetical protein
MAKIAKNGRKVKAMDLFFAGFSILMKNGKISKNGRKVKATALLYCCFFPCTKSGKSC